jgi:hypothetical protein
MMAFILGLIAGMVIGWNLFPQPSWALFAFRTAVSFIRSKLS